MTEMKEPHSARHEVAEPRIGAFDRIERTTAAELITSELYQDGDILLDTRGQKGMDTAIGDVHLKTARDGHTVLVPQPLNDVNDPLNWPSSKKYAILFMVCVAGFMGDLSATVSASCIIPQSKEWKITPTHVNYAGNLNVLMGGLGGLVLLPFFSAWGRMPVLFWTTFFGVFFVLGSALVQTFNGYYALRALTGLTLTAEHVVGLAFIKDIFFVHQHARMIGIWVACFLGSPYLGPMFGNFIIAGTNDWRNVYWMTLGLACFQLVVVVAFGDESWYRRDIPEDMQPPRGNRLSRVVGIWQIQHHNGYFLTLFRSLQRILAVLFKPIIIPILIYYAMTFMWGVGINQTSSLLFALPVRAGGYGFSLRAVGFLFFTPVVGIILAELLGTFLNDWVVRRYVRSHGGRFKPEARLTPIYFLTFLAIGGLVLIGQTLHKHLPWVGIAFGWGMYVFAYLGLSVCIQTYALDSYPTASAEVSVLINFSRVIGGFSVGYFQLAWGTKDGYNVSFGIQAALVAAAMIIFIPLLHVYGPKMRTWGGPVKL